MAVHDVRGGHSASSLSPALAGLVLHEFPCDVAATVLSACVPALASTAAVGSVCRVRVLLAVEAALAHLAGRPPPVRAPPVRVPPAVLKDELWSRLRAALPPLALPSHDEASAGAATARVLLFEAQTGGLPSQLSTAPLTRTVNLLIKDVITLAGRAGSCGTAAQGDAPTASGGSIGDSACDVVAIGLLFAIGVESKAAAAAHRPTSSAPDTAALQPQACASAAVLHARTAYASVTKMLLVDAIRAVAAAGGDAEVAQPCLAAMEALLRGLPRGDDGNGAGVAAHAPLSQLEELVSPGSGPSSPAVVLSELVTLLRKVARNPQMLVAPALQQQSGLGPDAVRAASSTLSGALMQLLFRVGAAAPEDSAAWERRRAVTVLRDALPIDQRAGLGDDSEAPPAGHQQPDDDVSAVVLGMTPPLPRSWPWDELALEDVLPQLSDVTSAAARAAYICRLAACVPARPSSSNDDGRPPTPERTAGEDAEGVRSLSARELVTGGVLAWLGGHSDASSPPVASSGVSPTAATAAISSPAPDALAARVVAVVRLAALWGTAVGTQPASIDSTDVGVLVDETSAVAAARHATAVLGAYVATNASHARPAMAMDPIGLAGLRAHSVVLQQPRPVGASTSDALPLLLQQLTSVALGAVEQLPSGGCELGDATRRVHASLRFACAIVGGPVLVGALSHDSDFTDSDACLARLHSVLRGSLTAGTRDAVATGWWRVATAATVAAEGAAQAHSAALAVALSAKDATTHVEAADAEGPLLSAFSRGSAFSLTSLDHRAAAAGERSSTSALAAALGDVACAAATAAAVMSLVWCTSPGAAETALPRLCDVLRRVERVAPAAAARHLTAPALHVLCVTSPLQVPELLAAATPGSCAAPDCLVSALVANASTAWKSAVALGSPGQPLVATVPFWVAAACMSAPSPQQALAVARLDRVMLSWASGVTGAAAAAAAPVAARRGEYGGVEQWAALMQLKAYLQTALRAAAAVGAGFAVGPAPSHPRGATAGWGWDSVTAVLMGALAVVDTHLSAYEDASDVAVPSTPPPSELAERAAVGSGAAAASRGSAAGGFASLFDGLVPPPPSTLPPSVPHPLSSASSPQPRLPGAEAAAPSSEVPTASFEAAGGDDAADSGWGASWGEDLGDVEPPSATPPLAGAVAITSGARRAAGHDDVDGDDDDDDDDDDEQVEVVDPTALPLAAAGSLFSFARSALSTVASRATMQPSVPSSSSSAALHVPPTGDALPRPPAEEAASGRTAGTAAVSALSGFGLLRVAAGTLLTSTAAALSGGGPARGYSSSTPTDDETEAQLLLEAASAVESAARARTSTTPLSVAAAGATVELALSADASDALSRLQQEAPAGMPPVAAPAVRSATAAAFDGWGDDEWPQDAADESTRGPGAVAASAAAHAAAVHLASAPNDDSGWGIDEGDDDLVVDTQARAGSLAVPSAGGEGGSEQPAHVAAAAAAAAPAAEATTLHSAVDAGWGDDGWGVDGEVQLEEQPTAQQDMQLEEQPCARGPAQPHAPPAAAASSDETSLTAPPSYSACVPLAGLDADLSTNVDGWGDEDSDVAISDAPAGSAPPPSADAAPPLLPLQASQPVAATPLQAGDSAATPLAPSSENVEEDGWGVDDDDAFSDVLGGHSAGCDEVESSVPGHGAAAEADVGSAPRAVSPPTPPAPSSPSPVDSWGWDDDTSVTAAPPAAPPAAVAAAAGTAVEPHAATAGGAAVPAATAAAAAVGVASSSSGVLVEDATLPPTAMLPPSRLLMSAASTLWGFMAKSASAVAEAAVEAAVVPAPAAAAHTAAPPATPTASPAPPPPAPRQPPLSLLASSSPSTSSSDWLLSPLHFDPLLSPAASSPQPPQPALALRPAPELGLQQAGAPVVASGDREGGDAVDDVEADLLAELHAALDGAFPVLDDGGAGYEALPPAEQQVAAAARVEVEAAAAPPTVGAMAGGRAPVAQLVPVGPPAAAAVVEDGWGVLDQAGDWGELDDDDIGGAGGGTGAEEQQGRLPPTSHNSGTTTAAAAASGGSLLPPATAAVAAAGLMGAAAASVARDVVPAVTPPAPPPSAAAPPPAAVPPGAEEDSGWDLDLDLDVNIDELVDAAVRGPQQGAS